MLIDLAGATRPTDVRPFHVSAIDATTLAVGGDVDLVSAPALRAALHDSAVRVVDLAAVTFMNAAGLGVLLAAHQRRADGLALRAPSACVRRLLELAGHGTTFAIAGP